MIYTNIKKEYSIELIEEHEEVNFYSLHMKDEELSELEKFFEKFPIDSIYDNDIDVIIAWMDKIGERGALERYFRNEGYYGEGLTAIPIETSKLRLYCIRVSDKILIFGNGDIKNVRSWQESDKLASYVKILRNTFRYIKSRIANGTVVISGKELTGDLNFCEYEKE